jgi:hypothetical protein
VIKINFWKIFFKPMKFNNLFAASLLIFFALSASAQEPQKPRAKFYRPSLTNVVVNSSSVAMPLVLEMRKIAPQSRFDHNAIDYGSLSITYPKIEDYVNKSGGIKGMLKEAKVAAENHKKDCQKTVINALTPTINKTVALWWGRDSKGNMSDALIQSRGKNTATDSDVIKDNASENSRLGEMGYELLSKSYIAVYEITDIKTMDQYYDEVDVKARARAEKAKKPFTPVKRTEEGWRIDYDMQVLKLEWTDSLQTIFWENFWVDESTSSDRAARVSAFERNNFPLTYVTEVSGLVTSTQSNDPNSYGAFNRRLSMEELLLRAAPDFQEDAIFQVSKQITDFRVRAPLFTIYPTTVKLGTKEGIYIEQRFYAYEQQLDKKGNKILKRKGVLRPTKIANNEGEATGESAASIFHQQGGKTLYQGMFVEMKEDYGFSATLALAPGFGLGAEINIPRLWKSAFKKSAPAFTSGLHIGAMFNLGGERNYEGVSDFQFVAKDTTIYVASNEKADVQAGAIALGAYIGKEIYPFKKGKFYLYPQIGIMASSLTINSISYKNKNYESTYSESTSDSENESGSSSATGNSSGYAKAGVSLACGLGLHLSPLISLYATPTFVTGSYEPALPNGMKTSPVTVFGGIRFKI